MLDVKSHTVTIGAFPKGVWIPRAGDRVTFRYPDHLVSPNFSAIQYGTAFDMSGVTDGFYIDRPNGGQQMITPHFYEAGVRWEPWQRKHGWERIKADKTKKLGKHAANAKRNAVTAAVAKMNSK